jgi:hypothetical protein
VTGSAAVSAWVTQGGAAGQVKVDMLAPGTEVPRESFITICSDSYLVYDTAKMVVYASGGAKVVYRGLVISADEVQLDVQTNVLKCKRGLGGEPIKLVRGHKQLDASLVAYNLNDMKGIAVVDGESGRVCHLKFRGADLATEQDTDELAQTYFDFADLSESQVLIKASSITVRPNEAVQFHRARVYVDGKKVLSVPLQVLPLGSQAAQTSQYVGWGTSGIRVDLPFFYSLTPNSTGSLHLRRGQQTGWGFYSVNSGWSLDLLQDYNTDTGAQGSFGLTRITGGDWGAQWHHNQQYDSGSRLYSYVEFPSHKDLFGMVNLTKPLGRNSLGVNLYGNKYGGQSGDVSTDVYIQSEAKPVARGAASYVLVGRTSYTTAKNYLGTGGGLGMGLQTQLYGRQINFDKETNLTSSLSFGHDWGGSRSGFSMLGNASVTRKLGQGSYCGLVYSYNRDPSAIGDYGRHRISANLAYSPSSRWQATLFSTYTLDRPLSSTFADISYRILPTWRLNVLQSLQGSSLQTVTGVSQYNYSNTEIALCKRIKDQELKLIWSTSQHKFRVELAAARF